jgi:hypothetical protein
MGFWNPNITAGALVDEPFKNDSVRRRNEVDQVGGEHHSTFFCFFKQ